MGGEQTQTQNKTTKVDPWGPAQPYLKQGFNEAQRLYTLGSSKYTPWSQVASFDPIQQNYMKGVNDYVNSKGVQSLLNTSGSLVKDLTSGAVDKNNIQKQLGQKYQGNLTGYMQNNNNADASGALNRFMYQTTSDPSLYNKVNAAVSQASNSFQNLPSSMIQNKYGIGQKIMGNLGDSNSKDAINQMMGNAYNMQDANRSQAIGLANAQSANKANMISNLIGAGDNFTLRAQQMGLQNMGQVLQNPLTLLANLGQVGDAKQKLTQNQLTDATNRWNFDQNAAYDNLVKYRNLLNLDPRWGTTQQIGTQTTKS